METDPLDNHAGRPGNHNASSEVLAIHPGALGDCILLTRVLEQLPHPVTFVGHEHVAKMLFDLGVVQRFLDFDTLPMQELFIDTPETAGRLSSLLGECNWLISLFGTGNPAVEQRLIETCRARKHAFLPIRPEAIYPAHLTDLWLDKLNTSLQREQLRTSVWTPPRCYRQVARDRLAQAGVRGAYFVLHPGAGAEAKCWPLERFIAVANWIRRETPLSPVFVVGPVEQERFATQRRFSLPDGVPMLYDMTLGELAGVLAQAAGVVGNDSGPSHLSAALGVTTIPIFGSTSATHFAPLGPRVYPRWNSKLTEVLYEDIVKAIITCRVF